jgi:hypothetical protein
LARWRPRNLRAARDSLLISGAVETQTHFHPRIRKTILLKTILLRTMRIYTMSMN